MVKDMPGEIQAKVMMSFSMKRSLRPVIKNTVFVRAQILGK